jgi:hypothetical protein
MIRALLKDPKKAEKLANRILWTLFMIFISAVLAFPVFVFFFRFIPPTYLPIGNGVRIDHVLTFIPVFLIVLYLALRIRVILIYLTAGGMCILLLTGIMGFYGWSDLYNDYKQVVYNLKEGARITYFQKAGVDVFPNASRIHSAIDFQNEAVRRFAVNSAVKNFGEYSKFTQNRKVIQYFSIFKEVRSKWVYVHDPSEDEFYSRASETVKLLEADGKFKGDCDDYSIMMAACIKAVGGRVRVVRTTIVRPDRKVGHLYPEVMVGNTKDLENLNYLIREVLFELENKGKPIYYCKDEDGSVWLNFDYNDAYPGGAYVSKTRQGVLEI